MLVAEEFSGIDSGVLDTVSAALELKDAISLYVLGVKASGTIAAAVITVQCSPDNVTWTDTSHILTFADETNQDLNNIAIASRYVRLKVTTKSTIASTVDLQINAK